VTAPPHAPSEQLTAARVPRDVVHAIERLHRPIFISHVVPDADALGAMLSLARATASAVRHASVAIPEGSVSQRLRFLVDWSAVAVAQDADFDKADSFVVLDTAGLERCNVGADRKQGDWIRSRPLINIDHHGTNTRFGSENWIEEHASSTCELVFHLVRASRLPLDAVTASLLYAGIQTDTLGFTLPTTSASALHAAAALVEAGSNVTELGERLCRSLRRSEFDLLRIVYANTQVIADGRIAFSHVSYDEITQSGCTAADIDDQINVPRALDGVQLAMLFSEGRKGKTRINFRGSGDVTVVELAAEFGGGGHRQAAGAVLDQPLTQALDRVVPRAVEHVKSFRRSNMTEPRPPALERAKRGQG